VGLAVNELPVLAPRFDEPLVEGNTLAIEPKYTHPDWGVIGVENTYAVHADRLENLTDIPEGIITCPE
jgi:Xaa-Pro aminopeptidase